jgi:hypothetical protein
MTVRCVLYAVIAFSSLLLVGGLQVGLAPAACAGADRQRSERQLSAQESAARNAQARDRR